MKSKENEEKNHNYGISKAMPNDNKKKKNNSNNMLALQLRMHKVPLTSYLFVGHLKTVHPSQRRCVMQ